MESLQNVKAKLVFKYFEDISNIPRGSKNEKAISDYLMQFGKNLGLEVIQDKALNIIIKKPATKGYENSPTVILQGHMDMVCEKNIDTVHDFLNDPIRLVVKDDYIYADGTTLGADDGMAVAYAMAILADDSIEHPSLEVLLTTDEETGMTGAMAVSKDDLKGKILINLDTEAEGYLLVSCAGGIRTKSQIVLQKEDIKNEGIYEIRVRGLKGGHSGEEINKGRANANKIIGRVLKSLECIDFNLILVEGGSKDNAIPRESDSIIVTNDEKKLFDIVEKWNSIVKAEFKTQDPSIKIEVEKSSKTIGQKLTKQCSNKIIDLLYLYPNGVNTMSMSIKDLTESSTNLGIVKMEDAIIEFESSVRSSVPSLKNEIVQRIKTVTQIIGGSFESSAGYPAWVYREDSKTRDICKEVYKEMYNKDMKVYAIHAGVECGLFEERLGNLDMVSLGPDIFDIHTPDEHLSISSTDRVFEYLLNVLKKFKNF